VSQLPALYYNQETTVVLSLYNPLQHAVPIRLQLCSMEEKGIPQMTADVSLPDCELVVAAKEDTADYGDVEPTYNDDMSVVHFRKANRLQFYINVKPLIAVGDVKVRIFFKSSL
jgi:hypothetical protein